jgi:hypothetical protein
MPRRTKACATCRQKRIKCDATMPHCQMCIKFNRQCPGPTDAPLMFIDTSSYPSGKKPRKKPSPPSSRRSSPPRPAIKTDPDPIEHERDLVPVQPRSHLSGSEPLRELPPELAYMTFAQISNRHAQNEALFSGLTQFFCAHHKPASNSPQPPPGWLHLMPDLSLQAPSSSTSALSKTGSASGKEALSLAIRATSAAFGGIDAHHRGLLDHAAGLYGDALRAQGRVVAGNASAKRKDVSIDMVAASVMLSMFEAVVSTTGRAYAEHTIGAAKMLDVAITRSLEDIASSSSSPGGRGAGGHNNAPRAGPGSGPPQLLTTMFFHIRVQLVYVLLTSTDERIRGDPVMHRVLVNACTWPSFKQPLNQQIIRPLAQLITLTFSTPLSDQYSQAATYAAAGHEVFTLWTRYQNENNANPSRPLCWYNEKAGRTDFRDPFTAIQYAYFAACRLLLDHLDHLANYSPMGIHRNYVVADDGSSPPPHSPASDCSSATFYTNLPLRPSSTSPSPPSLTNSSSPSSTMRARSRTPSPPRAKPDHFELILSVAAYLRIRAVGFSYLRLHVPLFLVALYAPLPEQRYVAKGMFDEWERGKLRGIAVLAHERLAAEGVW